MFKFFESKKEDERIQELFKIYKYHLDRGKEEQEAIMAVWSELQSRGAPLRENETFQLRDFSSKKKFLEDIFSLEVNDYDIFRAIEFIISWEFYKNYNETTNLENIRKKKDKISILKGRVKEIGEKIIS